MSKYACIILTAKQPLYSICIIPTCKLPANKGLTFPSVPPLTEFWFRFLAVSKFKQIGGIGRERARSVTCTRIERMAQVRTKLSKDEEKQLCQLLGNVRLCLLYKGSVHGFTAQVFHFKCDLQGPTLVVAYNNSSYVYGGFSSEGFRSKQQLLSDDKAFLVKLNTGDKKDTPLKIPVKNPNAAIYDHSSYGPHFGNGALHFLNGGAQVTTANTNDYDFTPAALYGNDAALAELEAYRVDDLGDAMDSPWRKISWAVEERKKLMELIRNYKPSLNKSPHIRVLMIGPVGAGKSSFFNSVNSVFRGHVATQAVAGSDATSVTKKYRTYPIKDGKDGRSMSIILCDSMGLEEKTGTGLDIEDIPKIIKGHVPDRYQFNPTASIQLSTTGFIKAPSIKDRIHCVVFVLDACKVGLLSEKLEEKLRQLRGKINHYDVPHLVLLTKVDELCHAVNEDIQNVYRSRTVEKQMHTAAAHLGIPVSCILPVKNYSYELELENNTDILILQAVQQIMRMADLYFEDVSVEESSSGNELYCA